MSMSIQLSMQLLITRVAAGYFLAILDSARNLRSIVLVPEIPLSFQPK